LSLQGLTALYIKNKIKKEEIYINVKMMTSEWWRTSGKRACRVVELLHQFPRVSNNDGQRGIRVGGLLLALGAHAQSLQSMDDWDEEGTGFATSGLGQAQDIVWKRGSSSELSESLG
jgi:hypothetical protein